MIYLSPLVSGRPDYSRSSMKKLRAPGIIELRTQKILMIRQNDIGDLLELNFSIAQSTPGTLEESLGTIFLVFRAYGISMKLLQKELGA